MLLLGAGPVGLEFAGEIKTVWLSPAQAVRAMAEASIVVRALSGGGEPVTFDGEFYQITDLVPAQVPAPPIWTGSVGPTSRAVTGRLADGLDSRLE